MQYQKNIAVSELKIITREATRLSAAVTDAVVCREGIDLFIHRRGHAALRQQGAPCLNNGLTMGGPFV